MRRVIAALLLCLLWPHPLAVDHIDGVNKMVAPPERVIECDVTAYSSTDADCGKHDGITATASLAGPGTVAADWRVLQPGMRLEIPGYGPAVVADRGGGIRGDRLDVWMHDEAAAKQWGRRKVEVRVLQ